MARRSIEQLCPVGGIAAWLCPSLSLIGQTLAEWTAKQQRPFSALAVASDDTVADKLVALGVPCPVTTDPEVIRRWLHTTSGSIRLVIGTHYSADRLGAALVQARQIAEVLVVDEAHYTAGRTDKRITVVHDVDRFPARRRLHMTATPRIYTTSSADEHLLSMDDPEVFGPVLFDYPFSQAIAEGWLEDYQLAVIGVPHQEALAVLRAADPRATEDVFAAGLHTAAMQVALSKAAVQWDLRRVICFCPRIADAEEFVRTLPRTLAGLDPQHRPPGPLYAAAMSGRQSARSRAADLDRLADPPEGGWTVLAHARVLGQGIDVPAADAVVFTRPKQSTVEIVQGVGRVLRPHPEGRRVSTVLVPILLPDDPHELTDVDDAGDWDTLWQVVRALRAHDDVLAAELDHRRTRIGDYAVDLPEKVVIQLPPGFDDGRWLQQITVRLIRSASSSWWEGLGAAQAFHTEHGHLHAGPGVEVNGYKLGVWLIKQRGLYRRRLLAADRVGALEELGMVWDPREERWQRMLAAARAFRGEHGHLHVPSSGPQAELATWLSDRRSERRREQLAPERAQDLAEIDQLWDRPGDSRGLAAAIGFHAEHGHLRVPAGHREAGIDLGDFLTAKRTEAAEGTLHPEVRTRLDAMGIRWRRQRRSWADQLVAVRAFRGEHGHLRVREVLPEDPAGLAEWLVMQRHQHRKGRLALDQVAALDALGFDWELPPHSSWDTGLAAAQVFHRRTGHLQVPRGHREGSVALDEWLTRRRSEHRAGTLTPAHVAALEALGIVWDPRGTQEDTALAAARAYHRQHGNLLVPATYRTEAGFALGEWIRTQRKRRVQNRLPESRERALDELGMVWELKAHTMQIAMTAVRAYHARHGHLRVPVNYRTPEGFGLGDWLRKRRRRRDDLPAEVVAELTALGVAWT